MSDSIPNTLDDLSKTWNETGRAYFSDLSSRLVRLYDDNEDVNLDIVDPRSEAMGEAVMKHVIALKEAGRSEEIRGYFDPAYTPLFSWIKKQNSGLDFVTLLGEDELLVRKGVAWRDDGITYALKGNEISQVDDVLAIGISRNRDFLVLARSAGLELRDARAGIGELESAPIARIPWPEASIFRPRGLATSATWEPPAGHFQVEQLEVSDDGNQIVISCYRQGILLLSRGSTNVSWSLLWPDMRPPIFEPSDDDGDNELDAGDMTHVALSRDGKRLAFGCQSYGHFLATITDEQTQWYATVGHLSEYPHFACFSDDGRFAALNSCHFYNGATVSFDWEGNEGAQLESYEEHDAAPLIDGSLRVYAARWLDRGVVESIVGPGAKSQGGFLLAGSGIMRMQGATGGLGFVQGFGSSASSLDFCPETRRIALGSYSGMLHVYNSDQEELEGRIDGVRPRRELYRWLVWDGLPEGPIRW